MNKNIKIYVATHKKVDMPLKDEYVPIQVGAKISNPLPYLKDSDGDNISEKNKNYCELTALYWIWKNTSDDIVGLTHYRRYFYKNIFSNNFKNLLTKAEVNKILNKYEIILPKKLKLHETIEENYKRYHNIDDLHKCGAIIEEIYPEYNEAFKKILKKKNMYAYNMFIMNKEQFDSYMEWLFNIFVKLEKIIDIKQYDEYNQRIYGFLSERLFNVWIEKNKLKIKEVVVFNKEKKTYKQYVRDYILGR